MCWDFRARALAPARLGALEERESGLLSIRRDSLILLTRKGTVAMEHTIAWEAEFPSFVGRKKAEFFYTKTNPKLLRTHDILKNEPKVIENTRDNKVLTQGH